jgi:sugar phosphate isomerase/epimerase
LVIVLDPANMVEGKDSGQPHLFAEACDLLGDRIAMAHAKDRDAAGTVVPAGTGIIDFDAFFAALARAGFTGPVVTHGLSAADAPAAARFLRTKIAP